MRLHVLDAPLAIARLDPDARVPAWASLDTPLSCITRTPSELSIVCADECVPAEVRCERGWRALAVEGQLDLSLTGVLASLATPLARAGVAIFAISTFDTDYVLVREAQLELAVAALRGAGHELRPT
jgi:uncharacterized protein